MHATTFSAQAATLFRGELLLRTIKNCICGAPLLGLAKSIYYINCSALASGSKSRKMVSHMCG